MYRVFGVARDEANDPQVKKIDEEFPDDEINNGIARIYIEVYGDDLDVAYIQVLASDLHSGVTLYQKLVEHWRYDLRRAVWEL